MNITEQSKQLFIALAKDAGNWSGQPLLGDGNVPTSKETRGNITQLKKAGLITTIAEEGCTWVIFTKEGINVAEQELDLNMDAARDAIGYTERSTTVAKGKKTTKATPVAEAAEPVKAGSKRDEMLAENEKRATKKQRKATPQAHESGPSAHEDPAGTYTEEELAEANAKAAKAPSKRKSKAEPANTDRPDGTATKADKPSFFGGNKKAPAEKPAPAPRCTGLTTPELAAYLDSAAADFCEENGLTGDDPVYVGFEFKDKAAFATWEGHKVVAPSDAFLTTDAEMKGEFGQGWKAEQLANTKHVARMSRWYALRYSFNTNGEQQ